MLLFWSLLSLIQLHHIQYVILLVCISLTLPTVSGILSPPEVQPRQFPICVTLHDSAASFPLQLVISLSLAYSHLHSFSHLLSQFSFSSTPLSSALTPFGKWRYVNCFLFDVYPFCYLFILMNSFPPSVS